MTQRAPDGSLCPLCHLLGETGLQAPMTAFALGATLVHALGMPRAREIMCNEHRRDFLLAQVRAAASSGLVCK